MLFDIRTIVGGLLAAYGVILIVVALTYDSTVQHMKTGGIDVNLWAGIGMLAAGIVFFAWVRLRPVRQPDQLSDNTSE
ncbi:hypothetical protein LTV02_19770 [Nocardia yamanashiensis]|uniref:hypothetical protein n=1 Tax=Nocardia yamanashiensis TaxID=209247 RepID=UPI001E371D0B|nr:hypothetical protein [Nocardia yamanashiensis]UGT45488.1 hypothetical protein LTV02_19770 [Nocardia yamanashiensis]